MSDQPPPQPLPEAEPFRLREPDCLSREELERELLGPIRIAEPAPPASPAQFSLSEVLLLMAGAAAGLAGGSWMPADQFAALLGLATLIGLVVVSWCPPQSRLGNVLWTAFVVAYFMAVLAAVLRPPIR